jgi:hypothetical protein
VNKFLEAITTERNKIPSATHQEENPPSTNRESIQNIVSAKEVCNTIFCQAKERFDFIQHV